MSTSNALQNVMQCHSIAKAYVNILQQFVVSLRKVFPECAKLSTLETLCPILSSSEEMANGCIQSFVDTVAAHTKVGEAIKEHNTESLFSLFKQDKFLAAVDMENKWDQLNVESRYAVWDYVETMVYYAELYSHIPPEMHSLFGRAIKIISKHSRGASESGGHDLLQQQQEEGTPSTLSIGGVDVDVLMSVAGELIESLSENEMEQIMALKPQLMTMLQQLMPSEEASNPVFGLAMSMLFGGNGDDGSTSTAAQSLLQNILGFKALV